MLLHKFCKSFHEVNFAHVCIHLWMEGIPINSIEVDMLDFVHFWEERRSRFHCCKIEADQSSLSSTRRFLMSLPRPIITVLAHFEPLFTAPTWKKVVILLVGTVLARGRRTVTAALRQMGRQMDPHFSGFHQVLNRARWSPLAVSRRLLQVLVQTFVHAGGTVEIVMDETLERRWGRKISKRGDFRDSLLSSKERSVSSPGLRWVTMALVVTLPWTKLRWALPFLSVLATTPKVSEALKQRHKTTARIAEQMVLVVRRWLPKVAIKVIGDGAYSVIELGLTCVKQAVSLIAPLRLDARLFAP